MEGLLSTGPTPSSFQITGKGSCHNQHFEIIQNAFIVSVAYPGLTSFKHNLDKTLHLVECPCYSCKKDFMLSL